jgi:Mrp family chromosome partitioning ATPase
VVGVCGVRRGAGATTIATALAEAFAEQGANVVLVQAAAAVRGPALDGDTAEASYGKRSDLPQDTWEFVAEPDSSLPSAAWADVSTAHWTGRRPPRGDDLAALVDELPPVHDVVVLDLPPVLESPLPTAVTPWVQDVVMLVRLPHELESDVTLAHGMLASTRADLRLQVVPNHPSRARLS